MNKYEEGSSKRSRNVTMTGDWKGVLNRCRATVSKEALEKEPSPAFKKSILIAEHNPIRFLRISWEWREIKSWCATHFARHVHLDKYISTQRDDRTGRDRDSAPQSAPVTFIGDGNAQALIDMMRKRLCRQAHPETRAYAEDLKDAITELDPYVGEVLVPNCVYRGACPELKPCGTYEAFRAYVENDCALNIGALSIEQRYALYNEWRKL